MKRKGIYLIATSIALCTALEGIAQQTQQRQEREQARQQRGEERFQTGGAQEGNIYMRATRATTSRIADTPQRFYGQIVQVNAKAEEVVNRHLVALDEDDQFDGPEVLLLIPRPLGTIESGTLVTVTGTVRPYNESEFQRQFRWFNPDWLNQNPEFANWERRPVIIGESVVSAQGRQFVQNAPPRTQSRGQFQQEQQRSGQQAAYQQRDREWQDQRQMGQRREQQQNQRLRAGQQTQRVLVLEPGEIADNPENYYGRRVRVQAEVEEVHGNGVFTLDEERWFAGPDVLVVAPGAIRSPEEGRTATVTGTLRPFTSRDVYLDYDWYGPGWYGYSWGYYRPVWTEWESRPVIIADSVQSRGQQLIVQQGQGTPTRQAGQLVYHAQPGDIGADPESYYGVTVNVRAEVSEAYNPHVFKLDEDRLFVTRDLLVLVPNPVQQAPEGQELRVIGTVQPFNRAQFERRYSWFQPGMLPGHEALAEWEEDQRPVLIANSVRTEGGVELVSTPPQRRDTAIGGTDEDYQSSQQQMRRP